MAHEFREGLKASLWPIFARPLDPMSLKELEGLDGMGGGPRSLAAMHTAKAGAAAGKGKGISFEDVKKSDAHPDGGKGSPGKEGAGAGGDKGSGFKVLKDDGTSKARAWPAQGSAGALSKAQAQPAAERTIAVDVPEEVLLGLMDAIRALSGSVRQVSDRLDVMAAVGKASAARLDKADPSNHPDGDINPPNSLLQRAPAPPRGGGNSSLEDEAGRGRAAADPIRRRVQLSDPDADGDEGEPPPTPTTQMLAATADILAAVASSRAAGKLPARPRPDARLLDEQNEIPEQQQMGGAASQGAGGRAGAGGAASGMHEGGGETSALKQNSMPSANRRVGAARVARLDSSMQVEEEEEEEEAEEE